MCLLEEGVKKAWSFIRLAAEKNCVSETALDNSRTDQAGKIKLFLPLSSLPRIQTTSKMKLRYVVFHGRKIQLESQLERHENLSPKLASNTPETS